MFKSHFGGMVPWESCSFLIVFSLNPDHPPPKKNHGLHRSQVRQVPHPVAGKRWLSSRTGIPQLLAKNLLVEGHVSSHQYIPAKERMAKRRTCIFLGEICWSNFLSTMVFRGKIGRFHQFRPNVFCKMLNIPSETLRCRTGSHRHSRGRTSMSGKSKVLFIPRGFFWDEKSGTISYRFKKSQASSFFPYLFIIISYFSHSKSSFPSSIILSLPDAGE